MALHVIVGKGPVGMTTAEELVARATPVRVLSRSGGRSTGDDRAPAGRRRRTPRRVTAAARGAGSALQRGEPALPPLAHRLAADRRRAARRRGAHRRRPGDDVATSTATADRAGPMTPETPLAATDAKGVVRARMWTEALAAHEAGRVRVTEARAADFVGPQVPADHSHLTRQLPGAAEGPARLGGRRPGRPAQLGLPARRRSHPGHARHRRAGTRPGVARAQRTAPLPARRRSPTSPPRWAYRRSR